MNVEVVVAMEGNKIVAIALMVAKEEVLAMDTAVVTPPSFSLLNGFSFGMIIDIERDIVRTKVIQYCFFSCHGC